MRPYQLLILILVGSLLAAALVGGAAKPILDTVVTHSAWAAKHLDYNKAAATYDIGKPFRHTAMGIALVALIVFARRLELVSLARVGLERRAGWMRQLGAGIGLGLLSVSLIILITFVCGARTLRPNLDAPDVLGKLVGLVPMVAGISLIEELLFRGFILQSFLKDMRPAAAILITSFVFAALHFLDAQVTAPVGFDPLAGFRALAVFKGMVAQPVAMLPTLFGLTLVGVCLSCAYVWTRSLYLSIGLHAGWVFALKASALVFKRLRDAAPWFFGNSLVVTGVLGIVLLLGVLGLLYVIWGRTHRNQPQETQ